MKKSRFETPVVNARTRFPGASLDKLAEIAGCSKKTVWAVLTARGMYRVGDNWGGARAPYAKRVKTQPKPQPLCTCCKAQPKRDDLRFLCDSCFREAEITGLDGDDDTKVHGKARQWAREISVMP